MSVWRLITGLATSLVIFGSGYWLGRYGKPYSSAILNLHKLLALAVAVFLLVVIIRAGKTVPLNGMGITAVVVTGLFFLATGIVGGLVALDRPTPQALAVAHQILPYLTAISVAVTLYLLFGRSGPASP